MDNDIKQIFFKIQNSLIEERFEEADQIYEMILKKCKSYRLLLSFNEVMEFDEYGRLLIKSTCKLVSLDTDFSIENYGFSTDLSNGFHLSKLRALFGLFGITKPVLMDGSDIFSEMMQVANQLKIDRKILENHIKSQYKVKKLREITANQANEVIQWMKTTVNAD